MKNKILALVSCFAILFSFASCSSSSADMLVTDDGESYIVARDEDGNIEINENGKLLVYTVNENGKKQKNDSGNYITEYIDFDGQVIIGNTVETQEMRYELPSGFVADADNPGYFFNESLDAEIFFVYYGTDIAVAVESAEKNCESLLENYGSEVFSYSKYTVEINGKDCTAFKQKCTSSEYPDSSNLYYIEYDKGYCVINCRINTENASKVNFDKFVKTIELK